MTDSTPHVLVATVGIDLGKNVFRLIGMAKHGRILWRQKPARGRLRNARPVEAGSHPTFTKTGQEPKFRRNTARSDTNNFMLFAPITPVRTGER